MTHTFSPGYFHRVSIISFPGNFLWEDWGGPEKHCGGGTAIVHRIGIVYIPDGSASWDVPGHYQKVIYRWRGAWSGLSLVSLSLLWFLVQSPSCWAMFLSSFSSITYNFSLLVMLFFLFVFFLLSS